MSTTREKFVEKCMVIVDAKPKYELGCESTKACDCIGMVKYSLHKNGVEFSTSGTNWTYRNQIDDARDIKSTADLRFGDVVFKVKKPSDSGYNLPSKFVIHTVGPIYYEHSPDEAEVLLTACYDNSLKLAKEKGLRTIAFPLISAGVYGYPQREAIKVAVETMRMHQEEFEEITLVLFGEREMEFAKEDYGEIVGGVK